MKYNGVSILDDFPEEIAIEAYKWFLGLTNKGSVSTIASECRKKDNDRWKSVRNTIRKDPYTLRFWKVFATPYIPGCDWCVYNFNFRCRMRSCRYHVGGKRNKFRHSIRKACEVFGVSKKEYFFVVKNLSAQDKRSFKRWVDSKVQVFVTPEEEKEYYNKIYGIVHSKLKATGNITSKVKKTHNVLRHFGENDEDDVEADMLAKIAEMVRRYDYLPEINLIRNCNRSLRNLSVNNIKSANAEKRKTNLGDSIISDEGGDIIGDIESLPAEIVSDEDWIIRSISATSIMSLVNSAKGVLKDAVDILKGKENPNFITFLKEEGVLKTRASWASFYNRVDPVGLRDFVNDFFSIKVENELLGKNVNDDINKTNEQGGLEMANANKAVNKPIAGGNKMSMQKIIIPKKKCVVCAYWIPFLGKKRIPKDCSPAFPGCPVHAYAIDHQFPIRSAAIQLKQFQIEEDNKAIKEFFEKTPSKYVAKIMEMAQELTEEDMEAVIVEEEDDDDDNGFEEMTQEDLLERLDGMNRDEMLAVIIENDLVDSIPKCSKMDEDELREAIFKLYENSSNDDDDDDEDDDDDDSAVIGSIKPIAASDKDE